VRDTGCVMPEESTTPDIVELNRRAIEAVGRGDLDAAMSPYRPDAVWDLSPVGLGTYKGVEAMRGLFADWTGAYDGFANEVEQIRALGNGVVLAVIRHNARPAGSTGDVEVRFSTVYEWEENLISRVTAPRSTRPVLPPNALPRSEGR
jgi:ketosteroid isomerase-like protein